MDCHQFNARSCGRNDNYSRSNLASSARRGFVYCEDSSPPLLHQTDDDNIFPSDFNMTRSDTRVPVKDMIISMYDNIEPHSTVTLCVSAVVGIIGGIALGKMHLDDKWATVIAFPGDLFVSALQCLVLPLVFFAVVVVIGGIVEEGKGAMIGNRTIGYFALCSISASLVGVLSGVLFGMAFSQRTTDKSSAIDPELSFACPSGNALQQLVNGSLLCVAPNVTAATANKATLALSQFALHNSSSMFASSAYDKLSVSDQVIGILENVFPDNIIIAFAGTSTLGVIGFAVCLGVAMTKSVTDSSNENYPLLLARHGNAVCCLLVSHVIKFIPIAIVSMIAGSMAQYTDSLVMVESVALLAAALLFGLCFHTIVVLGSALWITTRRNVFGFLRNIVPAQVFSFGCGSSVATLPVTIRCVDASQEISLSMARFFLPLGATCNLNGTAVYMPLTCIFMAHLAGLEDKLTVTTYLLLLFVGAVASFGVAPVPHSGLVMVITVWRTVFNQDVPSVFSVVMAADWILNRMRTVVNITNDTILCRIVAEECAELLVVPMQFHAPSAYAPYQPPVY